MQLTVPSKKLLAGKLRSCWYVQDSMNVKDQPVLTDQEREFLSELLASAERELLLEIHHADSREYRTKLHNRLSLLESVRKKL